MTLQNHSPDRHANRNDALSADWGKNVDSFIHNNQNLKWPKKSTHSTMSKERDGHTVKYYRAIKKTSLYT